MTTLIGTVIGIVHVAGIDGVALPSFGEVLEASSNGAPSSFLFTIWLLVASLDLRTAKEAAMVS